MAVRQQCARYQNNLQLPPSTCSAEKPPTVLLLRLQAGCIPSLILLTAVGSGTGMHLVRLVGWFWRSTVAIRCQFGGVRIPLTIHMLSRFTTPIESEDQDGGIMSGVGGLQWRNCKDGDVRVKYLMMFEISAG